MPNTCFEEQHDTETHEPPEGSHHEEQPQNLSQRIRPTRTRQPPIHLRDYVCNLASSTNSDCFHTLTNLCTLGTSNLSISSNDNFTLSFNAITRELEPIFYNQAKGNPN